MTNSFYIVVTSNASIAQYTEKNAFQFQDATSKLSALKRGLGSRHDARYLPA